MTSTVLSEIVAAVGMPAAIHVARIYGGDVLRVPESGGDDHPLVVAIGGDLAARFFREFRDRELYVPAERTALIAARDASIVASYRSDPNVSRIARENRLTRSMIRKILRKSGL